jgi:phospholipase/carboxylesterase
MRKEQFGELKAYVTGGRDGEGDGDGPVVILMHGFGAPGFDLVDLGDMLEVPEGVRFVFPEAPLALGPGFGGGRAWWMLDMALFEARARGEQPDRSDEIPPTLAEVSAQVAALVDEVEQRLGAKRERLVLGGFSQGSMLACDVALHMQVKPAALLLMSSTLIARQRWQAQAASCRGLPVLQSHGSDDPILSLANAERLADLLRAGGAELSWLPFRGGHQIPPEVLGAASRLIQRVLA